MRVGACVREDGWLYRAATAALEAELAGQVAELVAAAPAERLTGDWRSRPAHTDRRDHRGRRAGDRDPPG